MEPTEKQKQTARLLNLKISSTESYRTLKARIIDHIADAIGEKPPDVPTGRQLDYAKSLGINSEKVSACCTRTNATSDELITPLTKATCRSPLLI